MAEFKSWVEENMQDVDCVLNWSSDQNILNYDGKHILFHSVDRTLLVLEEALMKNKRMGVLVYPVNKAEIAIPLCVEALYSLMSSHAKKTKVLLVSQDLSVRELYWNLKANYMRINEVFPLGIIKMDGYVKPQLKTADCKISDVQCAFLHVGNPNILPDAAVSSEIGCLVVDTAGFTLESVEQLIKWAVNNKIETTVFLESNPYSDNFTLYDKYHLPVWGWDSNSLHNDFKKDLDELERNPEKYSNPFSASVFLIKNWLQGIKREFIIVDNPDFTVTLNEALHLYYDIKKLTVQTEGHVLSKALISYLSCKYAFERMLAPIGDIEAECKQSFLAKTVEKRIESLERWQNLLSKQDPYFGSFWGKTYALTKELYLKFQSKGNPKYEKLRELVKGYMQEKQRVLIFNYSEPYARALISALMRDFSLSEEELEKRGVIITSIVGRQIDGDFDKCIVFGQVPFRASWLLRVACAKEIIFLIYPTEKLLLKYQFEKEDKKFAKAFGKDSRVGFMKNVLARETLQTLPSSPKEDVANSFSLEMTESEHKEEEKMKSIFNDLQIDDELVLEEDVNVDEEDDVEESTISKDGEVMVKCCKMRLDDGTTMYFKPSRKLPIFKEGKKLEYLDYKRVKQGELLIVIKNNIRNNLAQEIIKKADNHPSMQRLKFLVNSWVVALKKGMAESNDSISVFLGKLQAAQQEEDCPEITNWLTIQLWRGGYIIGPQNQKNIKLIGIIYKQQFLIDNYKEIGAAISRLRGIHQRLLRKFNEMVMLAGLKSAKAKVSDEVIDEEFNLHLEDFADVISFTRIVSIEAEQYAEKSKLDKKLRE